MARLIDADAFLEALENADADVCETYPDFYCDWGFSQKAIEDLLLNIPTMEAKPVVHGEWLDAPYVYFGAKRYVCSECKDSEFWEDRFVIVKENFCPNCGADMRERIDKDV